MFVQISENERKVYLDMFLTMFFMYFLKYHFEINILQSL